MLRGLTLVILVLAVSATCLGQANGKKQQPGNANGLGNNMLNVAKKKGTIEAISGMTVKIKTEDGQEVLALINPTMASIAYSGEAEKTLLMRGTMVRFTGEFSPQGKLQQPLSEIEIFRPSQMRRMRRDQKMKQMPGITLVEGRKKNAGDEQRSRNQAETGPREYRVIGQLIGIKNQDAYVQAGRQRLQIQFAEDVQVKVATSDLMYCRKGDMIEVQGLSNPQQNNMIQAQKAKITAAEKLSLPDQKSKRNTKKK